MSLKSSIASNARESSPAPTKNGAKAQSRIKTSKLTRRDTDSNDPPVVVNVYYFDAEENKATLVGRHIPVEGMLQVSNHFAEEGPELPRHPRERNTICWDLPSTEVSLAGTTAFFNWVASLKLPLPDSFNGRKTIPLEAGWGILQLRSLSSHDVHRLGPQLRLLQCT